jgi:hypothetical protein
MTRATLQTGVLKKRNPNQTYLTTSLAGNTQKQNYDSTNSKAVGAYLTSKVTNYLLRSREFNNAAWTATDVTVTADQIAGVDGTSIADKLVSTAANGTVEQSAGAVTSNQYTCSAWLRADSGTFTNTDVELEMHTDGTVQTFTGLKSDETEATAVVGTTWKRVYINGYFNTGTGNIHCLIRMITDSLTIYADAAQLDGGTYSGISKPTTKPQAFIYTVSTTATQTRPNIQLNKTEISNIFSMLMMWQPTYSSADTANSGNIFFKADNDVGSLRMWSYQNYFRADYLGTNVLHTETWTPYSWHCVGFTMDTVADSFQLIYDGAVIATDTTAKGNPTYSTYVTFDNETYDIGCECSLGEVRIYKGVILTAPQITSECDSAKLNMGLP